MKNSAQSLTLWAAGLLPANPISTPSGGAEICLDRPPREHAETLAASSFAASLLRVRRMENRRAPLSGVSGQICCGWLILVQEILSIGRRPPILLFILSQPHGNARALSCPSYQHLTHNVGFHNFANHFLNSISYAGRGWSCICNDLKENLKFTICSHFTGDRPPSTAAARSFYPSSPRIASLFTKCERSANFARIRLLSSQKKPFFSRRISPGGGPAPGSPRGFPAENNKMRAQV